MVKFVCKRTTDDGYPQINTLKDRTYLSDWRSFFVSFVSFSICMPRLTDRITNVMIATNSAIRLITESTLIKLTSFQQEREDIASSLKEERTTATVMVILYGDMPRKIILTNASNNTVTDE